MKPSFLFLFFILAFVKPAYSRVFSMGKESFGGYFLLTGGNSAIKDKAFANESTATAYDGAYNLNTGGEFGFSYLTGRATWRFGFEVIKPTALSGVSSTLGGSEVYQVKSDLSCYIPKIGIELIVKQTPTLRLALFGYGGTASLAMKNDYSLLTIAPNADFSLESKSAANLMGGGFLTELYMMDTTTFMLELGYRDLKFKEIKYSKNVASAFNGSITAGDVVVDNTGANRMIDLSGAYISVGFRIWLY